MLEIHTKILYLQLLVLISVKNIEVHGKATCMNPPPFGCPSDIYGFYYYRENSEDGFQLLLDNDDTIKNAPFLPGKEWKLVIHGYAENRNAVAIKDLREAYFRHDLYNMIFVDWSKLATWDCYLEAFKAVPHVGECTAQLIRALMRLRPEINIEQIHVIGFSLGAQSLAQLSNSLQTDPGIIFNRFTGLDPASPGFWMWVVKKKNKLNKMHARFVECYHTDVGVLGVISCHAHLDLYANSGTKQPGCDVADIICSHGRALAYWTESINTQVGFYARRCRSVFNVELGGCDTTLDEILIGEYCKPVPPDQEGPYQFHTHSHAPFAEGDTLHAAMQPAVPYPKMTFPGMVLPLLQN